MLRANHPLFAPLISLLSFSVASAALIACKAQAEAKTQTKTEVDHGVNFDIENSQAWNMEEEPLGDGSTDSTSSAASGETTTNPAQAGQSSALFGARHDVFLSNAEGSTCRCLAVALGQPSDQRLTWTGLMPQLNASTQFILALGSEGLNCDFQGGPASYAGYEVQGKNVVVTVEEAKDGRPITHGAIIPRPSEGGQLLIHAAGEAPYGRAVEGNGDCSVPLN
ncbi:MAG: hypothetical protein MK135_06980 [Polyangiaceae bacterium]|nr:hypothetical protein [Polyangiaceae bacterium]